MAIQRRFLSTLMKYELPKIIDLFSGCGGLSSGFQMEGFEILYGLDMNKAAVETANTNIHKELCKSKHFVGDVRSFDFSKFESVAKSDFILMIGGPPCQAYSPIGRAKLRSLGEHRKHTNDKRGQLYRYYIAACLEMKADIIVMENVPEATNYDGVNIPQTVCEILDNEGYECIWTILNSADYGVPQIRERVFVIAFKKGLVEKIYLPEPTNRRGYFQKTFNSKRINKFNKYKHFKKPLEGSNELPLWVTVGEAISDLPSIFSSSQQPYKLERSNKSLPYKHSPSNEFQLKMRDRNNSIMTSVTDHRFRKTPRDFPIFEEMEPGANYKDAVRIANKLFLEECHKLSVSKHSNPEHFYELRKKFVPPYDSNKFVSKWKKLDAKKPSHTLVAHLGTDTYSHIHPWEPRGISVREAARLQSFNDDFHFSCCSMGDAFKQIGNAVPPLLANAIAKAIRFSLEV